MKSTRLRAVGLLCLAALFVFSCTYPTTIIQEPPAEEEPETPPAPVIEEDPWALYVIDAKDLIVFEDHCTCDWAAGGWVSREQYRYDRKQAFLSEINYNTNGNRPWRLVEGIIWYPGCGR